MQNVLREIHHMEVACKKVLIVEDEPDLALLIRASLEPQFDALVACDAERALEIMRTENIDAIIADVVLPNMDGTEFVVSLVKENKTTRLIPIVVMTGLDPGDLRVQVLLKLPGVYGVLAKPFRFQHLEHLVKSLLDGDAERARFYLSMSALR